MSKALSNYARNSASGKNNNAGRTIKKGSNDGSSAVIHRTQSNAALSNVSHAEATLLSSLSAEEFNALIEERSEIARGM